MNKLMLIMIICLYSVVVSANTTGDPDSTRDPTQSMPLQLDDWHYAGLQWYEVGDNLVFIFPARDFYSMVKGHVQLKHQAVLLGLAKWLKTIPKTWVRFTGVRYSDDKMSPHREALQDAQVLATYFWDAGIDARGIYTKALVETGVAKRDRLDRVEMVVRILPQESVLM